MSNLNLTIVSKKNPRKHFSIHSANQNHAPRCGAGTNKRDQAGNGKAFQTTIEEVTCKKCQRLNELAKKLAG